MIKIERDDTVSYIAPEWINLIVIRLVKDEYWVIIFMAHGSVEYPFESLEKANYFLEKHGLVQ